MSEIIREDGRVVVPEAIRRRLGLGPGVAVDFVDRADGLVVLQKAEGGSFEAALTKWSGFLREGPTTDEIMEMSRGEG